MNTRATILSAIAIGTVAAALVFRTAPAVAPREATPKHAPTHRTWHTPDGVAHAIDVQRYARVVDGRVTALIVAEPSFVASQPAGLYLGPLDDTHRVAQGDRVVDAVSLTFASPPSDGSAEPGTR